MSDIECVTLGDGRFFAFISGLWKGKRAPFSTAAVLRSTNFRGDGFLSYDDIALLDVEDRQLASRQLQSGDIVIERSGGGPKQPVGRVALFEPPDDMCYATSNFTTALRVLNHDAFDPAYVCLFLHALYLSGATETLQRATTGIRNLDWGAFQSFAVPRLSIDDQRAVAALLRRTHKGIVTEDAQVAAVTGLKRAAMQSLFTRGLRGEPQKETDVGLLPQSWEVRTIRELCIILSGGTPRKATSEYWGGDVPWVSGKDLKQHALDDAIDHLTPEGLASGSRLAPAGAVLVLVRGMGLANDLPIAVLNRPMAFNQDVKALVPRSQFSGKFLRSAIYACKDRLLSKIVPSAHGTMTLNLDDIETFKVPCPSAESEAEGIVDVLDALDHKIDLHRRKRAVLDDLFKALLNKLVTGRIPIGELDALALGPKAAAEVTG